MATLLTLFISLLLHELAHYVAAWFFYTPVKGIVVRWYAVGLRRGYVYGWKGATIALAGIAANLVMWRITGGFAHTFNAAMIAVNILPLRCSDGFHAYQAVTR